MKHVFVLLLFLGFSIQAMEKTESLEDIKRYAEDLKQSLPNIHIDTLAALNDDAEKRRYVKDVIIKKLREVEKPLFIRSDSPLFNEWVDGAIALASRKKISARLERYCIRLLGRATAEGNVKAIIKMIIGVGKYDPDLMNLIEIPHGKGVRERQSSIRRMLREELAWCMPQEVALMNNLLKDYGITCDFSRVRGKGVIRDDYM